jgi:iron complex outermembrane receptor protein
MTQHYFAKTEVNWWYSDEGKIKFIIGQQRNIRKEYDVRRSSDKPIIDLDLITSDYQLEWKHPDWYHLDGIIGLQYFNQNSDNNPGTGITPLIPNYNINRISAFAIESKKLKKNTFEAGIRFDYENNNIRGRQTNQNVFRDEYNFSNFNTSLGYIRNVNNKITFRSNVGVAWRTPNMAELYSFGQHGFKSSFGLLRYQFNNEGDIMTNQVLLMEESDIKPEKGYKWIHEFQFKNDHQTHSITAYTNLVLNYVQERPLSLISTLRGPNPLFIYEQTDVFMAGVDYSWAHQWIKNIEGTFGASYLWSRNIENGSVLIAQPPINLNYAVEWNFPEYKNLKTKILLEPSYTFEQFQAPQAIDPEDILNLNVTISEETEIFDFQEAPEGFFLLNASVRFEWKHLSGQVRVNNLLDTKYRNYLNTFRYFADELGRNIVFNLSYKFQAKQKNVNK